MTSEKWQCKRTASKVKEKLVIDRVVNRRQLPDWRDYWAVLLERCMVVRRLFRFWLLLRVKTRLVVLAAPREPLTMPVDGGSRRHKQVQREGGELQRPF